jgi:hypothetical protein
MKIKMSNIYRVVQYFNYQNCYTTEKLAVSEPFPRFSQLLIECNWLGININLQGEAYFMLVFIDLPHNATTAQL